MKQCIKKKDLIIFSLIWILIFLGIGLYPLLHMNEPKIWSLSIATLFILITIIRPSILKIFYNTWLKVGDFIGGIISKVIMFILYFMLFTPISFILKILGKDLLRKKVNKNKPTYWIIRDIQPESMKNQF